MMSAHVEVLPNFVSSLSKYFRVEEHHHMLESIDHDTPEQELRQRFGENLYATGKQRYLTVNDGVVRRDRLIDLIHAQGVFTERVKMVMYFLFLFRDSRYRQFICERVGTKEGKWDTSVFRETGTAYFKGVGGHKAFTNLRQFLIQTGILGEKDYVVHMPNLALWFPSAVEIAADSIEDPPTRKRFLASPHGFLIRHKLNALLNATPTELATLEMGGIYEEVENLLPAISLPPGSTTISAEFQNWDRLPPARRKTRQLPAFGIDTADVERANYQHWVLEKAIADLCKEHGHGIKTTQHIDLLSEIGDVSVIFEMKSCTPTTVRAQVRRAVSQLLEYRYLYREKLKRDVRLCAVIERKPSGALDWLCGYLESLQIGLIWKNSSDNRLNCTEHTKRLIADLLPQVDTANFGPRNGTKLT
jgi:hypothetical protein